MSRIAVVTIGGNSLIKDKKHQSVPDQYEAITEACYHIANMVDHGYEVAITHGNGPQIGFILLRSELARNQIHTVPLDSCGADTQGAIGYNIQQALYNEFTKRGVDKDVVTLVTQVVVIKDDKAFLNPSKPIGPFYSQEEAEKFIAESNWNMKEDAGRGWRRVVPSPKPRKIIEIEAIRTLIQKGLVVVAVGGGGIPVIEENGMLRGIEAVIDKDYASSRLAVQLGAELLMIATAVEKVALNFKTPQQKDLDRLTLAEAERYLDEGHFAEGSMAPKIKSVIFYLKNGGKTAIITTPECIDKALRGETGTRITR
ncbi:carbamate kinase [bacterium]|nr:carbamate kinase [bacterium]